MKLELEVFLNLSQLNKLAEQIKELYPEVYGHIYNEGFNAGQDSEGGCYYEQCSHCDSPMQLHCFDCDPHF